MMHGQKNTRLILVFKASSSKRLCEEDILYADNKTL